MKSEIPVHYRIIRWTVAAILVADLILVGVNWRLAQSPRVSAGDLARLELAGKCYRADTARLRFEQHGPSTFESSIEELLPKLICRAGLSS